MDAHVKYVNQNTFLLKDDTHRYVLKPLHAVKDYLVWHRVLQSEVAAAKIADQVEEILQPRKDWIRSKAGRSHGHFCYWGQKSTNSKTKTLSTQQIANWVAAQEAILQSLKGEAKRLVVEARAGID